MTTNESKGFEYIKSLWEGREYKCTFEVIGPDGIIKFCQEERDNFYVMIYQNPRRIIEMEGYVNASKVLDTPLKRRPGTTGPSDKLLMYALTRYNVNVENAVPILDDMEESMASVESQIRKGEILFEPLEIK